MQGDLDRMEALNEESLAVRQGLPEASEALRNLGMVALARGDQGRATALLEEVLPRSRAAGSPWGQGMVLAALAQVALARDEPARASVFLAEAGDTADQRGHARPRRLPGRSGGGGWPARALGARRAARRGSGDTA